MAPPLIAMAAGCGVLAITGAWVQWRRYPSFRLWPEDEFRSRHRSHTFWISWIVVPAMALQGVGVAGLVASPMATMGSKIAHVGLALLSLGITFAVSGPIHGGLSLGRDPQLINRLIRSNGPRTAARAFQALLAAMMLLSGSA